MFLDLIFPKFCLSCGMPGEYACVKCFRQLLHPCKPQICPEWVFFNKLIACLNYDKSNFLRKLIARFKYRGADVITVIFSELMIQQFARHANLSADYLFVPVPMHKNKKRRRGFNQAERLAVLIADGLGYSYVEALSKTIDTENQSHLGRNERLINIQGSIGLNSLSCEIFGRNVVLVDDVATTLTTLNECSKVLKSAGAVSITCLVLARAMPIGLNSKYENWN